MALRDYHGAETHVEGILKGCLVSNEFVEFVIDALAIRHGELLGKWSEEFRWGMRFAKFLLGENWTHCFNLDEFL